MGGAVSSVAGGLLGKSAAGSAADAMRDSAYEAAALFAPYSVSSPIGTLTVDQENKEKTLALSSQTQGLLDLFAGEAGQGLGAATAERLGILDQLAARGEEDARRSTQERLFSAGALGTHYGTRQIGEVERAIADSRLARMLSARDMAFNERQTAFGNSLALYQLPNTLGALSTNRNPAAGAASMGLMNAASIEGAADLSFANSISGALGSIFGGKGGFGSLGSIGSSIGSIFGGGSAFNFGSSTPSAAPGFSTQFPATDHSFMGQFF